jgi:hypothetical protein
MEFCPDKEHTEDCVVFFKPGMAISRSHSHALKGVTDEKTIHLVHRGFQQNRFSLCRISFNKEAFYVYRQYRKFK